MNDLHKRWEGLQSKKPELAIRRSHPDGPVTLHGGTIWNGDPVWTWRSEDDQCMDFASEPAALIQQRLAEMIPPQFSLKRNSEDWAIVNEHLQFVARGSTPLEALFAFHMEHAQ